MKVSGGLSRAAVSDCVFAAGPRLRLCAVLYAPNERVDYSGEGSRCEIRSLLRGGAVVIVH